MDRLADLEEGFRNPQGDENGPVHWETRRSVPAPSLAAGDGRSSRSSRTFNDTSGQELKRLTYGVHWNDFSYPAWTQNGDDVEFTSIPSTPGSTLNKSRTSTIETRVPPPLSIAQIAVVIDGATSLLGFQFDSAVNIFELLMSQLDSRASRSDPSTALATLHADYIGGPNANYRKWIFASKMDLIDRMEDSRVSSLEKTFAKEDLRMLEEEFSLKTSQDLYTLSMTSMSDTARIIDLVVYLLCWGEANQIRFMPECLDFVYKCARDYYQAVAFKGYKQEDIPTHFYLDKVITRLYDCYRDHNFKKCGSQYIKIDSDHKNTIGYDDMNQLFWYHDSLRKLVINGKALLDYPRHERYLMLQHVEWNNAFCKTYKEVRSWWHLATNFSRIWIIHGSIFWFYTAFNSPTLYTVDYDYMKNNQPAPHIRWTIVALGGAFGPLISIFALIGESMFVPRKFAGAKPVLPRMLMLICMFVLLVAPSGYLLAMTSWKKSDTVSTVIAGAQMSIAILYTAYFSFQPLLTIADAFYRRDDRRYLANEFFTSSFQKLCRHDQFISALMAVMIFAAKLTESYFYLTLSLRDPIRELSTLDVSNLCVGDLWIGSLVCKSAPLTLLCMAILTDVVLFFLDTYLWYVIFNILISVTISFYGGASVWTPWRNVYARLPQRISSKLLTNSSDKSLKVVWNSIIESMFHGYLISRDQARKLIYSMKEEDEDLVVEPSFFTSEEDRSLDTSVFKSDGEAYRRISFFAQSLATPIPEPLPIQQMPAFSVLIPHYSEKIILSLRETIRQENEHARVTVLEYLQRLYPAEWECFVKESQEILERENPDAFTSNVPNESNGYNISISALGFSSSNPRDTNRTRIWCSARMQTLYRTVAGFMNYSNAIKLLCFAENDNLREAYANKQDISAPINNLINRKFRMIVAIQRLASFNDDEIREVDMLLSAFPGVNVAYVDTEVNSFGEITYYSSLIDSSCPILEDGRRRPRYRIRISGNPILGDGKSDNQNHALPFYRGEYIQLIDSNQDNYLEECIKIRNVLMEFEEAELPAHPYTMRESDTVAIVGAREYVFSENIGVLGDVAAGKEQTFGTLFARTLAKIGGKLHYGHPDFLNAIFMTTRGGVSKAQKGLHLNEDIYAGMTAVCRGGRIKHTEYIQCGKGRDLGFISILNFVTKIGAGMGEQILSREYFYLGTQLPLDRFLSFYYAHPGFHLNNLFIMVSLELFVFVELWLASIYSVSSPCQYDPNAAPTAEHLPLGCQNVYPIIDWLRRCVVSIFVVFFISLLPLFVQELAEKGFWRSCRRLGKHLGSLSMLFEIFVCRIYAQSFSRDMSLGGAKYIGTGRGFATSRMPLYLLFQGYASQSLYFGFRCLVVLVYVTIVMWQPALLWFWVTTFSLCLAPVLYNPHQFLLVEFFLDYKKLMAWFTRFQGDDKKIDSWTRFNRECRAKITGYKTRTVQNSRDTIRPSLLNLLGSEVGSALIGFLALALPYLFVGSQRVNKFQREPSSNPLLRILICSFGPMIVNLVVLIVASVVSIIAGLSLGHSKSASRAGNIIAMTTHIIGVFVHFVFYWVLFLLENRKFATTVLGLLVMAAAQRVLIKTLYVLILPRLHDAKGSNDIWWTGKWASARLGWRYLTVPFQELLAKTCECSLFTIDFLMCHLIIVIQLPLLLIPYFDKVHSVFLLWLRPGTLPSSGAPSKRERQLRTTAIKHALICGVVIMLLGGMVAVPVVLPKDLVQQLYEFLDEFVPGLVQESEVEIM